ncbi:MAG: hypothetical protein V7K48_05275 [Nostoc sp.]
MNLLVLSQGGRIFLNYEEYLLHLAAFYLRVHRWLASVRDAYQSAQPDTR